MPTLRAERLRERLAERDADVLDGVVLIDVEVAVGLQLQVEGAVPREQLQHVVEEPDAGLHLVAALALDAQRDVDPGLARVPLDHALPHRISSMASMHARVWATSPVVTRTHPWQPGCRSRSRM